ncbi:MAG: restriction endonuclease [Synergistaceae bacterium]|nr:restriction endonuclease [Synergistaceae bacterium]
MMPIPAAQEIRKPLLEAFKGEAPRSFSATEFLELMAGYFELNLNDLSSGDKNIFKSRISEAKTDLRKNHLLSNPSKNIYMITSAGLEVLEDDPAMISDEYLAARKNKPLTVEGALGLEDNEALMPPPPLELDPEPQESHDPEPESDMPQEITEPEPEADMPQEITEPDTESEIPAEIESPHDDSENVPEISEPQEEITPEAEPEYEPEPEPEPESEPEQAQKPMQEPEAEYEPENEAMNESEQIQHEEAEYEAESESYDEDTDSGFVFEEVTPAQRIEDVITQYNSHLADEILMKTAAIPSDRFEMLVIDLLSKMGYFAFQTARYTTETAGSDMIHGVILDNKTGANIYIQARKLSPARTVGKADIQDFAEELADKGGKGIFATTANFSEQAKICANDERIMLIDGVKLANLMIANNFCVNVERVFEVKSIDVETFSEYED